MCYLRAALAVKQQLLVEPRALAAARRGNGVYRPTPRFVLQATRAISADITKYGARLYELLENHAEAKVRTAHQRSNLPAADAPPATSARRSPRFSHQCA